MNPEHGLQSLGKEEGAGQTTAGYQADVSGLTWGKAATGGRDAIPYSWSTLSEPQPGI